MNNKYPSTRIDGFRFIHKNNNFVPEIKSDETLNKIKNIVFPTKIHIVKTLEKSNIRNYTSKFLMYLYRKSMHVFYCPNQCEDRFKHTKNI